MAPFCDTINHHNVDSSYDVIKAEWRPLSFIERMQRYPDPQNPFACKLGPFADSENSEPNIAMSESTTINTATEQAENSTDSGIHSKIDPELYKVYDTESGENEFYHTVCKS